MDREQLLINITTACILLNLVFWTGVSLAAEETVDIEFLVWLGQVAEVEELGVDVDELLDAGEPQTQSEGDEEKTE